MNDGNANAVPSIDKPEYRDKDKVNKHNPHDQLGPGKGNKTKNKEEKRLEKSLLRRVKSIANLIYRPPKCQDKK